MELFVEDGRMEHLTAYVFTTRYIVYDDVPVLRVIHETDGDWQFLNREDSLGIEDAMLVSLGEMLQTEDGLWDVVSRLDKGEMAVRAFPGAQWVIRQCVV